MTGVQTLVPVMLDHVNAGRLTLERLVDLTSHGPQRLFGIRGKGRIAVGYDADSDMDILQVVTTYDGVTGSVKWWENSGGGTFPTLHVLTDSGNYARGAAAADVDSDGDLDTLGACGSEFEWYENPDGSGSTATRMASGSVFHDRTTIFARP